MDFFSAFFAILFLGSVLARVTVGRKQFGGVYVAALILASVLFYAWGEQVDVRAQIASSRTFTPMYVYLLVLVASAGVNYLGGVVISRLQNPHGRRGALAMLILLNLGLLAYFKYTGFFISNVNALSGGRIALPAPPNKTLPLGISYYTFAALSYLLDVYFKRTPLQKNPANVFLFLSFFPKLISGPITRASDFFKQLEQGNPISIAMVNESVYLFAQGAFLKVVCADSVAAIVNENWNMGVNPNAHALDLILLALLYSVQIFCDFAGYSQMARGIALLLGFRLPVNFLYPYTANSFTAFWRNWHVSLTEWVRIYLFYPLERLSRKKAWLFFTPILVMFLTGLWHGANWTFVVWGLMHGVGMALERILGLNRADVKPLPRLTWALLTQFAVVVGWVIFRSSSLEGALAYFQNIYHGLGSAELRGFSDAFLASAFPAITSWRASAGTHIFSAIVPVILDTLPILSVVILHLHGWAVQRKENAELSPLALAVLTGVLLFLTLSAYPLEIGKPLYGSF